eukprot:221102-Amphidinium_carterae.3
MKNDQGVVIVKRLGSKINKVAFALASAAGVCCSLFNLSIPAVNVVAVVVVLVVVLVVSTPVKIACTCHLLCVGDVALM